MVAAFITIALIGIGLITASIISAERAIKRRAEARDETRREIREATDKIQKELTALLTELRAMEKRLITGGRG